MTRKEIIDKLECVEKYVKEIRKYLSQGELGTVTPVDFPLAVATDFKMGYTLDDLYREFGKKKPYATRLKSALKRKNINTLEEFLSLTPGELLELESVGYKTLLCTKKALERLGLVW